MDLESSLSIKGPKGVTHVELASHKTESPFPGGSTGELGNHRGSTRREIRPLPSHLGD